MKLRILNESVDNNNDLEKMKQARKNKILADYRKYACIKENDPIDTIDEWALNEACFKNNYRKDLLRKDLELFRSNK